MTAQQSQVAVKVHNFPQPYADIQFVPGACVEPARMLLAMAAVEGVTGVTRVQVDHFKIDLEPWTCADESTFMAVGMRLQQAAVAAMG